MALDPTTGTGRRLNPYATSTLGGFNRLTFALGVWMPTRLRAAKLVQAQALRRLK